MSSAAVMIGALRVNFDLDNSDLLPVNNITRPVRVQDSLPR